MSQPHRSDPELVVLHALRCAGTTSADRLGGIVARVLDVDTEAVLLDLAVDGLVTHHGGGFGGWELTQAGRAADQKRIAAELDATGARPVVQAGYDVFLTLNSILLDICHDWQMRSSDGTTTLNDHEDAAYDRTVLDWLADVDRQAQSICASLASRLHRFGHYGPRLHDALQGARQGQTDLVTDSLDSYHTVWFQLHEDLLTTLDLPRGT